MAPAEWAAWARHFTLTPDERANLQTQYGLTGLTDYLRDLAAKYPGVSPTAVQAILFPNGRGVYPPWGRRGAGACRAAPGSAPQSAEGL